MDQVPEEKKDSVTKTLAILGFVGIIILIVWLAVQVVALVPSAFSSLASIANTVYNPNTSTELIVKTENSVVNDGESFIIDWTKLPGNGTYGFAYKCAEGVSIDMRKSNSVIEPVACNTFVDLGDVSEVEIMVNTEKQRFTDIEYAIAYNREGVESVVTDSVITVVNATIPTTVVENPETPTETETEVVQSNQPSGSETTNTGSTNTNTGTSNLTPGEPRIVKQYIWQIPESDPYGYVDLAVTHIAVGEVKHGVLDPRSYLEEDEDGAIQFEVRNIGTKTSGHWDYEVELPNGDDYKSGSQYALKPNERVVITIGFDDLDEGKEEFSVEIDAKGDTNSKNDDYEKTVRIKD